jgi:hypothetical protein
MIPKSPLKRKSPLRSPYATGVTIVPQGDSIAIVHTVVAQLHEVLEQLRSDDPAQLHDLTVCLNSLNQQIASRIQASNLVSEGKDKLSFLSLLKQVSDDLTKATVWLLKNFSIDPDEMMAVPWNHFCEIEYNQVEFKESEQTKLFCATIQQTWILLHGVDVNFASSLAALLYASAR